VNVVGLEDEDEDDVSVSQTDEVEVGGFEVVGKVDLVSQRDFSLMRI